MPTLNQKVKITKGRTLPSKRGGRGANLPSIDVAGAEAVVICERPEKAVMDGKEEVAVCITSPGCPSKIVTVPVSQVRNADRSARSSVAGWGPGQKLPDGVRKAVITAKGTKFIYEDGRIELVA